MPDRSVESTSTRLPAQGTDAAQKQGAKPKGRPQVSPTDAPTGETPEAGTAAETDTEKTAVRPGLGERIQAKLTGAADEHRASASAGAGAEAPAAAPTASGRPPRRARLRLTRIDPWSVMKTAFLLAIAFGVVTIVSVLMVWSVLGAAGVWDSINSSVRDIVGGEQADEFNIENYLGTARVLGFTTLVAVVDVVLLTAIATLGAFLYNMAAALLGGIEVTLAEDN
ncbi:DUF3566 domain-containing protein [Nocardioides sp. dk4132]|uniref:DUF3566 domain-containing protein n=1 Tax=unclassified Nocardioides TaxID=2615069 RepID=UPI001296A9F7|nr:MULTISPECIES: DUF3566 domain-containing protein [unclassified Nocardioides]MQW77076.1 DUF3566 domain-containing protein [Nocardioides sp. dk4132]QGA05971.1 DUF3566 domain-containing protein [Nocardioides sp. dk884]